MIAPHILQAVLVYVNTLIGLRYAQTRSVVINTFRADRVHGRAHRLRSHLGELVNAPQ